jgi:hypothetical protein
MFSTPARRRFAWFVIGILSGALVLLALVAIVQTRDLAGTIRSTQKANTETVDIIRDCTRPAGRCFMRGQRQTARAVADINRVTVYAAACASKRPGQTATQIRSCVVRMLARADNHRRTP